MGRSKVETIFMDWFLKTDSNADMSTTMNSSSSYLLQMLGHYHLSYLRKEYYVTVGKGSEFSIKKRVSELLGDIVIRLKEIAK